MEDNKIELVAEIVSAYVENNSVPPSELPGLIANVHRALSGLSQAAPEPEAKPTPAVNPKRSVFPDYLISLEDGKQYRTLKRHLSGRGMTPADYRAKWGLPHDYPMVAASYAEQRSALAKSVGLGRKRQGGEEGEEGAFGQSADAAAPEAVTAAPEAATPAEAPAKAKRGRKAAEAAAAPAPAADKPKRTRKKADA